MCRIHFTDNYGYGAIDVENHEVATVANNLREDPNVDGVWVEDLNEEEC